MAETTEKTPKAPKKGGAPEGAPGKGKGKDKDDEQAKSWLAHNARVMP